MIFRAMLAEMTTDHGQPRRLQPVKRNEITLTFHVSRFRKPAECAPQALAASSQSARNRDQFAECC